jgi:hypothetical protein
MNTLFPPSIFGARCDVLMDIVVVSMAVILPLLWYSFEKVRYEHRYKLHKNIQLTMFIRGKIGMWDMALTCITGLVLYVFGFML